MAKMSRHSATAIDQLQETYQDLKERLQDLGGFVKGIARERWDGLREGASRSFDSGRDRAHQIEEGLEEKVRENPMRWVLISVGVGLLLGTMLKRRR